MKKPPNEAKTEVRTPQRRQDDADAPHLPHERDESEADQALTVESQKAVVRQAHEDLARGLRDTDRRGGADYQRESTRRRER